MKYFGRGSCVDSVCKEGVRCVVNGVVEDCGRGGWISNGGLSPAGAAAVLPAASAEEAIADGPPELVVDLDPESAVACTPCGIPSEGSA